MSIWVYAFACVAVPAVWGVAMVSVFGWVEKRRKTKRASPPPVDYAI